MGFEKGDLRSLFLRHVCQTSQEPLGLEIVSAHGPYVTTVDGHNYLDLLAGIGVVNIGHGHPQVLQAIETQARRYLHAMVYGEFLLEPQIHYAARLADVLPGDLDCVYFCNSGAEAVEGALKTARKATGRRQIFSFTGCYHGDTMGALSLQSEPLYRAPYEPLVPDIASLPWNTAQALERITTETAAVIIEPVQGEGGVRIPDPDFLPRLRQRCDDVGALLIFDEVMTGFGRTGRLFACEHWNVVPDIVVMAKALGGGLPLGAFAGRRDLLATLSKEPPLAHVTTFGGHPLSCAAGLAALNVLQQEGLVEQAASTGDRLLKGLQQLQEHYDALKAVRGMGCLLGMEFETPQSCRAFAEKCLDCRLIVGWTLFRPEVIRLSPPLILSQEEVDRVLEIFADILRSL